MRIYKPNRHKQKSLDVTRSPLKVHIVINYKALDKYLIQSFINPYPICQLHIPSGKSIIKSIFSQTIDHRKNAFIPVIATVKNIT